jgi:UDP-galactopyranose mutase
MIAIVGAGITGAVIAERYASKGHTVHVFEKRDHIAGNCYDYIDENNIIISKYGPHFFHTNNERVWDYIQQFATWIPYEVRVKSRVGEKIVPVPVNINTVNELFGLSLSTKEDMEHWLKQNQVAIDNPSNSEEVALSRVGHQLYELMFKGYTTKQWERPPSDLNPSVLARIPVRDDWEDRYFTDKYQALPKGGYTKFIGEMFNSDLITVHLNRDFFTLPQEEISVYEKVYFTGPIDQYFAHAGLDKLEYRSLRFEYITVNEPFYQTNVVINEPSIDVPYTRTAEYKHLPIQEHPNSEKTTIVREYSISGGDPYYPIPNERNLSLYKKYQELAEKETKEKNVYFVGRLASYKYFNMDQAIDAALDMFESTYQQLPATQ